MRVYFEYPEWVNQKEIAILKSQLKKTEIVIGEWTSPQLSKGWGTMRKVKAGVEK